MLIKVIGSTAVDEMTRHALDSVWPKFFYFGHFWVLLVAKLFV